MTEARVNMESDLAKIWRGAETNLRRLVSRVQEHATGQELRDIRSFLDANEFGEAFELICFVLADRAKEIPPYLSFELQQAATGLGIPISSLPARLSGKNPGPFTLNDA